MSEHPLNKMPPPGGRKTARGSRSRADTRARILNAATQVFARYGYARATTAAIARAAAVAEGSIYNHFESKDDLILTIFQETWRNLLRELKEGLSSASNPIEKLALVLSSVLDVFEKDPLIAEVFLVEFRQSGKCFSDKPMALILEFMDLLEEILKEGVNAGLFRRDMNTKIARSVLFGGVENVLLSWRLRQSRPQYFKTEESAFTLPEAKENLLKLLGFGLFSGAR